MADDRSLTADERSLKRVLLVEDDPDVQMVASLCLSSLGGLSVEVCGSAREAAQCAPAFKPDLILLDVMMPGTDGFGALDALRKLPETATTPIVFLTARAQPRDMARYRQLGSLGVITKPFDPTTLADTLSALWQRRLPAGGAPSAAESTEQVGSQ
jgi:CheY-like chemotaxis protein